MKCLRTLFASCLAILVLASAPTFLCSEPLPTWDKQINNPSRFEVLKDFNDEAVLDHETGLVWEKVPETARLGWAFLDGECYAHFIGGRLGWRPPTLEELLTLMDPLQNLTGKLPVNSPFDLGAIDIDNLRSFWTATSDNVIPATQDFAFYANFEPGGSFNTDDKGSASHRAWCVRGGHGYDRNLYPSP